jgi:hypothetical protein
MTAVPGISHLTLAKSAASPRPEWPDLRFTPHQIGKVLTRSSGVVANALDKLVSLGVAELASDKPRSYRLAPAAPAPGSDAADDHGGEEATASAA